MQLSELRFSVKQSFNFLFVQNLNDATAR